MAALSDKPERQLPRVNMSIADVQGGERTRGFRAILSVVRDYHEANSNITVTSILNRPANGRAIYAKSYR